jgi:hypothetical protein
MGKLLNLKFDPSHIIKNSQELKLVVPTSAKNGSIHSDTMISMESYTLSQGFTKTLDSLAFNPGKEEYIVIQNNIGVTSHAFSLCMWILAKSDRGTNGAIFDYYYETAASGGPKVSNQLVIKTGDEAGKLVLAINNTSITTNITKDKWFHLCWIVEHVAGGVRENLAKWTICINGKMDNAIELSNKVYLDTTITNNRILLGKGSTGGIASAANYFNGSLAEITLYDQVIDPTLDIYSEDPTVKYIIGSSLNTAKAEGFKNYDYGVYTYGGVGDMVGGDEGDESVDRPLVLNLASSPTRLLHPGPPTTNYENMGLGIFFIILSVVIYKYF